MKKAKNNDEKLIGEKYGRLTIIGFERYGRKTTYKWKWVCRCDCGNIVSVVPFSVRSGETRSCGCLRKDKMIQANREKRENSLVKVNSRLYSIWCAMISRCYNKNLKRYKNYGGRGIKVCDEWRSNYPAFYEWSMRNGYSDVLMIDRIDVDGDYEPRNCRWADSTVQARNKTNTKRVYYNGYFLPISELSDMYDIPYGTLYARIYRYGWSVDRALKENVIRGRRRKVSSINT